MKLRTCLRKPVPEIFEAAALLDAAIQAHLARDHAFAAKLLVQANMPAIRDWTESLWGASSPHVKVTVEASSTKIPRAERVPKRMPGLAMTRALHERDGYHCRFCGVPLVRREVRKRLCDLYPELQLWGRTNLSQHAALQAMWSQYDHLLPHSYGGTNEMDNLVVTCAPCNFARMEYTLEQVSLANPLLRPPVTSTWDGLERLLVKA